MKQRLRGAASRYCTWITITLCVRMHITYLLSVLFYLFGGIFIRTFIIQTVTRDYSYKTNIYPTIQTINNVSNFVCD